MSITLQSSPYPLTFIGSKPSFVLACNNEQGGTTARIGILLSASFPVGKSIFITIGGNQLQYTKVSSTPANAFEFNTADSLRTLLESNYYLCDLLTVQEPLPDESNVSFYLVGRSSGPIGITVTTDASSGCTISGSDGTRPTSSDNYSVLARFETNRGNTSWMRFAPISGKVKISAEMLSSIFPAPTLPTASESFSPQYIPDTLSARLRYAECFGDTPLVQQLHESDYFSSINGTLVSPFDSLNVPDWYDENPDISFASQNFVLRVIGEDSGQTVRTYPSAKEYLYLIGFNTAATSSTVYTIQATILTMLKDGTSTTTTQTLSLNNRSLYRLPVSPSALGLSADAAIYQITLSNPNGTTAFSRVYSIRHSLSTSHQFLLQNRYGLLQTFLAFNVQRAATFDGDTVINDGRSFIDIKSRTESFSVISPMLSRYEAEKLAHSFHGRYCYYFIAGAWKQISIQPSSLTYHSDDSHLCQLSFTFSFCDNQPANIPSFNDSDDAPATADGVILTEDGFLLLTEDQQQLEFE